MAAPSRFLAVRVHLMEGRYHGVPEWPPGPARLFQAMVAGAARAGALRPEQAEALRWLEGLAPPTVAAPVPQESPPLRLFVPNNDLDAKGGDPADVGSIRVAKEVRARVFDPGVPLLYAWAIAAADEENLALEVCALVRNLYQLGRGVDMAWASAEILEAEALEERLAVLPVRVHRPTPGAAGRGQELPCPEAGSLASLDARYRATLERFEFEGTGRRALQVFRQAPKARFTPIAYDGAPRRTLFDLRDGETTEGFARGTLKDVGALTVILRDGAFDRLKEALPGLRAELERGLVGLPVEGQPQLRPEQRIRVLPLPSIGHDEADPGVRRVLVEVPHDNPLRADDLFWAFSGLRFSFPTGEKGVVIRADQPRMLRHYGLPERTGERGVRASRTWHTITPAVLPEQARRRRIEPARASEDAKGGRERAEEEARAQRAVIQALRHAGFRAKVERVRVQREPFFRKGERAGAFAKGTRFPKERLWHVKVTFDRPMVGPIVLGDGRFMGLGLMAPCIGSAEVGLSVWVKE